MQTLVTILALTTAIGLVASPARAHCDTESGPVAVDARKALETGRYEPVGIWVGPEQDEDLRAAFNQALPVYKMGGKARDLAERHFTETAVRLHRQAEELPFTGLKPAQALPADVAAAERSLDTGDLGLVSELLTSELRKMLQSLFQKAREAREDREASLAAGREWADAYVKYVIYVHGLYGTIQAGPAHGVGE